MRRRPDRHDTETAIANFSLTLAKTLLAIVIVLAAFMSISNNKEGIKPKVDYILTTEWDASLKHDVDIWIKNPAGEILFFRHKQAGFMTLERDDLGIDNAIKIDGNEYKGISAHEEIVSFRGVLPGEYIINVHLYAGRKAVDGNTVSIGETVDEFPVRVKLVRLNPTITTIFDKVVKLSRVGQEVHVARVEFNKKKDPVNISTTRPAYITDEVRR